MGARFIVMTSSASMPASVKSPYRHVAVVETDGTVPKMISERARGMVRIVERWGPAFVGRTERCAYQVALREAEAIAAELNAACVPVVT